MVLVLVPFLIQNRIKAYMSLSQKTVLLFKKVKKMPMKWEIIEDFDLGDFILNSMEKFWQALVSHPP